WARWHWSSSLASRASSRAMALRRSFALDDVMGTSPIRYPVTSDRATGSFPLVSGVRRDHPAEGGAPVEAVPELRGRGRLNLLGWSIAGSPAASRVSSIRGTGGTHGGSPRGPIRTRPARGKCHDLARTCGPSPSHGATT